MFQEAISCALFGGPSCSPQTRANESSPRTWPVYVMSWCSKSNIKDSTVIEHPFSSAIPSFIGIREDINMLPTTPQDQEAICTALLGKAGSFDAYFAAYNDVATSATEFVEDVEKGGASLRRLTHQDILATANFLRDHPNITLAKARSTLHKTLQNGLSDGNIRHALNVAVQAMLMVDPQARERRAAGYSLGGYHPTSWLQHETFAEFLKKLFPPPMEQPAERVKLALDEQASIRAWKLQDRLGLRFRGTDNIAEHLLYDRRKNTLYLFHHTSFLKTQLERFRGHRNPLEEVVETCLPRGTLPPQILVETLHSLQSILFWWNDNRSARILDRLIKQPKGFDEDSQYWDGLVIFHELPGDFKYQYWGERLAALHSFIMQKPPRNRLERWFEKQSTEGNALFIALIALLISIVIGIISIGLAAFQTWIAWMAWKYPVE